MGHSRPTEYPSCKIASSVLGGAVRSILRSADWVGRYPLTYNGNRRPSQGKTGENGRLFADQGKLRRTGRLASLDELDAFAALLRPLYAKDWIVYAKRTFGEPAQALERFLNTAVRWARDSVNGNPFYKKPDNPWRRCADLLFAATSYE
jgi:hypothetical protein